MGIDDPTTIDIIVRAADRAPNAVDLVIVDAGLITDDQARYAAFMAKLKTYVAYALSPEFLREHPGSKPADVAIKVVHCTPPTAAMLEVVAVTPRGDPSNGIAVRFERGPEFP